jgi:N6-adenosine-specific RNA methylase IME4
MTPSINPKFHALIPPLTTDELAQLETNLLADGCRDPLVTWNGVLLDGHNRFDICQRHKLPFNTVEMEFADEDAACDWIDANQLGRRNLTPDQRANILGRRVVRAERKQGERTDLTPCPSGTKSKRDTIGEIAKDKGVSRRTAYRAANRYKAIEKLAETAPEEARAVRDGLKRFNEVRREMKRAEVQVVENLPDAKFRVIYADPPWKYGDQLTEDYGPARFHYPSMTIKELCAMPVRNLTDPDAVLFLWVTSPLLFECVPIIEAWGFTYKTSIVWWKKAHNMGHYVSNQHEFLLICTRGSCTPDNKKLLPSVLVVKRGKHSAKPKEAREMIDQMYPYGKRIELFARGKLTMPWESWGNQSE